MFQIYLQDKSHIKWNEYVACILYAIFILLSKLFWGLCPVFENIVYHLFCLFVSWVTCVWHGVCLFWRLNKLCLVWGLSVCASEQVMFGMGFVCLCT